MKRIIAAATIMIAGAAPAFAEGHSAALGAIEGRQALMSFVGSNMRPIGTMAQGGIDFNAAQVQTAGRGIAAAATAFPHLFPEGSETGGDTKAAEAAFTDAAGLAAIANDLKVAGDALSKVTAAEELGAAFGAVAATCKACHSKYQVSDG